MVTAASQKPLPRPAAGVSPNCARLWCRSKNQNTAPTSNSSAASAITMLKNRQDSSERSAPKLPASRATAMARPVR